MRLGGGWASFAICLERNCRLRLLLSGFGLAAGGLLGLAAGATWKERKRKRKGKQQADKRVAPVSRCLVHSCPQCVMRFADCVMKRSFRKGGFVGAKGALWRLGRLARWPTILFRARVRHKLAKANEWQSGEPPQPPSLKCYLSTNVLPVWARDRGGTTCALQRKSFC